MLYNAVFEVFFIIYKSLKIGITNAGIILCILIPIFSVTVLLFDFNDILLKSLTIFGINTIGYLSSYSATQKYREKGAIQGIAIGLAISLILLITTLILNKGISEFYVTKLIYCIISSLLGGIVGVNTRKTKVK